MLTLCCSILRGGCLIASLPPHPRCSSKSFSKLRFTEPCSRGCILSEACAEPCTKFNTKPSTSSFIKPIAKWTKSYIRRRIKSRVKPGTNSYIMSKSYTRYRIKCENTNKLGAKSYN